MPANILPANPVDVMPKVLCRAFMEKLTFEALANTYPDGSSDRVSLVLNQGYDALLTHNSRNALNCAT